MSDESEEHDEGDDEEHEETAAAPAQTAEPKPRPKKKPAWCSVTRIERYTADGRRTATDEPCRLLDVGEVAWLERFKRIDATGIAKLWGGGRYRVQWHYATGQIARKDAPLDIPGESLSADHDATRPAAPEPEPPAAAAPAAEPEPLPGLPKEMGQLGSLLSMFEFFEQRAERRMKGSIDMMRAQNDAYVRSLEALQNGAIERERARTEAAMREQEARHKRDREHLAELARQTREATDIDALAQRLEAVETQESEPEWLQKLPDLIARAMRPVPGERGYGGPPR